MSDNIAQTIKAAQASNLPYKLLVLDLDGTLITENLIVPDIAKQMIAKLTAAGVIVTVATGRMFRSALPIAQSMNLSGPLICYQGAMVRHSVTGETLYHNPLPLDIARDLIKFGQENNIHLNTYVNDQMYVAQPTPEADFYANLGGGLHYEVVGDLLNFTQDEAHRPTKLVYITSEEKSEWLLQTMQAKFEPEAYITRSYPIFIEAINPTSSKGAAVKALAELYNIPRYEVMTIGDNLNDVPMLEYAGLGVAVANATTPAKAAAKYVTAAPMAEGVVEAVEKFIFNS